MRLIHVSGYYLKYREGIYMMIKELSYEDKMNKEVYEGLQDLEILIFNNADRDTLLDQIKKMKMKYDAIPF